MSRPSLAARRHPHLSRSEHRLGLALLYLNFFFLYVRPQEIVPGLSSVPVAGLLSLLLSLWALFYARMPYLRSAVGLIFVLGAVFFLSGLDAVNVSAYKYAILFMFTYFPQCLAMYILVQSRGDIESFLRFWIVVYLCMGAITIVHGGRGPGDFTDDENDAALALIIGVPIAFYGLTTFFRTGAWRQVAMLTLFVLVVAIVVTSSRGGFLGFVTVVLVIWYLSRRRLRNAFMALLFGALFGGVVVSLLPSSFIHEVESIDDAQDSTRIERLNTWEVAWYMFKDNPVLGVGAANFPWYVGEYQRQASWWHEGGKNLQGRVTHSMVFQVLSELGTIGVLLYGYIVFVLPRRLLRMRTLLLRRRADVFAIRLCDMLIASMAGYFVSGIFISVAYYPHVPVWLGMYAIVRRHLVRDGWRRRRTGTAPPVAPGRRGGSTSRDRGQP